MITDLPVFQIYSAMARHAAESQRVSTQNIARASEPGYKAQKVENFEDFMQRAQHTSSGLSLPSTFKTMDAEGPASPNGNSVNLEKEIFNSAQATASHEMAITVYKKSVDLMKMAIGRR